MNQPPKIKIGKWSRPVKGANGKPAKVKRHTVNFRCPETGKKRRLSFKTKAQAEAHREVLRAEFAGDNYFNPNTNPTVSEVADHWLEAKRGTIKPQTVKSYKCHLVPIVGPLLQGTAQERGLHAITGDKPHRDAKLLLMLGDYKVSELTSAQLRRWHSLVREECGAFTSIRCMSFLKSILALAEEDFGVRTCKIPSNLPRRKHKPKKEILSPDEVAMLIAYAQIDKAKGIYYAFPFLTGVRVSEQLALRWADFDLDAGIISIRRVQERNGSTTDTTKTEAGTREVPLSATLRAMLMEWRLRRPRIDGELYRVFPSLGPPQQWPLPRVGGSGPLLYGNYRKRYWAPCLKAAGVKHVGHHSARHSFVSTLQAQGVEVELVAKLAGHSNPAVTLGHYTQAVRGGAEAVALLDRAYQGGVTHLAHSKMDLYLDQPN